MRRFIANMAVVLLLCLNGFVLKAQKKCGTVLNLKKMSVEDPEGYRRFMEKEHFIESYARALKEKKGIDKDRLIDPNGTIIIPVVVHILHRGEAEGSGLNISMVRIQQQLDILNKDYRRLNADRVNTPAFFAPRAADMNIEFRLACYDPNGNPTNGVERKYAGKAQFTTNGDEVKIGIKLNSQGGADAWPTNRYLNIWVCNVDLYGYGTFPQDYITQPQYDGVVVAAKAFGITNDPHANGGRTLAHEVGHWLDLIHIWGDDYCGNDFVGDTPTSTNSHNGLRPTFPHQEYVLCDPNNEPYCMFMNFMDYSDDVTLNLFTNGQKTRARACFATVNGVKGARADQLNNGFFGFAGQPTEIACKSKITVSPLCLPVTWTITGPATITSGMGTSQIEITPTGLGTVHLTASSGNYFSETDVLIKPGSSGAPTYVTNLKYLCGDASQRFEIKPVCGAISYTYTLIGSNVVFASNNQPTLTTSATAVDVAFSSPIDQQVTLKVKANYSSSSSAEGSISFVFYSNEALNSWNPQFYWIQSPAGGGGAPFTVSVDPAYVEFSDLYYYWYMDGYIVEATSQPTLSWEWWGERTLQVKAGRGCGESPMRSSGIPGSYFFNSNVALSPNPATSKVKVSVLQGSQLTGKGVSEIRQIQIFDKLGNLRKVVKYAAKTMVATINVSSLPTDVYTAEIFDGEKKVYLKLSVKK